MKYIQQMLDNIIDKMFEWIAPYQTRDSEHIDCEVVEIFDCDFISDE